MEITIIAAKSKNNVIGKGGKLPWHFPEDLKHFRETTMGKFVIMGRKTYLSLPGPLEGRKVIVLSRDEDFNSSNAQVVNSVEEALKVVEGEVFIAGGASIYKQFIDKADKMILTIVDEEIEGGVYFPNFKESNWELKKERKGKNKLLTFKTYKRL